MKNLQTFLSISALSLASSMSVAAVDESKIASANSSNSLTSSESVTPRTENNQRQDDADDAVK